MIPRRSRKMTSREHACMALITAFEMIEKRTPSLREIEKGLGISGRTQAGRIIERLIRRGLITRNGPPLASSRNGDGSIQIAEATCLQIQLFEMGRTGNMSAIAHIRNRRREA